MSAVVSGPVAVFGATGQQGGAVVFALLAAGASVRALVRDPDSEKAQGLAQQGAEVVQISLDEPATVVSALEGVSAFFFLTALPQGEADASEETRQGFVLAGAAAAAKVPHVVYTSVGGVDRGSGVPHFEAKLAVEQRLVELGVPVTFVRPVFFADNLRFLGPSLENGEIVVRVPLPDGVPLQLVAVRDIGAIVAKALLEPGSVPSGVEIAGDARTGSEIAVALQEHTGIPARYEALPLLVLDGQEDLQAMFRWFAETPAYQADLAQVRDLHPTVWDLPEWLTRTGYTIK